MEPGPRQDRISNLYHRALGCSPDERRAFLQTACDGDVALRDEVESLLRYESGSARFLETPAAVVPGDFAGAPDESQMIGRQFGPSTLVAPMGPLGKYSMFSRPHGMIGGMMNKPPEMAQVPPTWQIYFRVSDINAAIARIKANGEQILNGPMEVPGGDWIVNAMDPQRAAFSLHAKKAQ